MKQSLIVAFLLLLITSCEKESNKILEKSSSIENQFGLGKINVKFQNKMLVFKSEEDYLLMTKFMSSSKDFKSELKNAFPNFISIEDAYFNFIESENYKNLKSIEELNLYKDFLRITRVGEEIFIDPLLFLGKSKLYNEQGFIQIGNEIIRREFDKSSKLKINLVFDFKNLKSEFNQNKSVVTTPVKLILRGLESEFSKNNSLEQRNICSVFWCNDVASNSCSSQQYRVRGELVIEESQPGNVLGSGAQTKGYKKGFLGIWALSKDGYWLQQSGTVTTTVLLLTNNTVQTATVNVAAQSSYVGSDNTIEKIEGSCCVQLLSFSYNVNISGTRYKNSVAYAKNCNLP